MLVWSMSDSTRRSCLIEMKEANQAYKTSPDAHVQSLSF